MNQEKALKLLIDYQNDKLTAEQALRLKAWYLVHATESKTEISDEQINKIQNRIRSNLPLTIPLKKLTFWKNFRIIAAAVTLIIFSTYFLHNRSTKQHKTLLQTEIEAGKIGATLTLANGKKVQLTDVANGEIAEQPGIRVTKTKEGMLVYEMTSQEGETSEINTLSTALGETYALILPDKSKVWLNSASSLTFSTHLVNNGIRKVRLKGEAYFEVSKNKSHRFVVQTDKQTVEVLGTHFNVNAYNDDGTTTTTLVEGTVNILSGSNAQIIKPGEQARSTSKGITVEKVNIDAITDWKEGDFYLDHVDFRTAMRKISRWYNVEIIYDPSLPLDMETGGWISRNQKLSSVLKLIESSGLVHFRVEGRKVYVSK